MTVVGTWSGCVATVGLEPFFQPKASLLLERRRPSQTTSEYILAVAYLRIVVIWRRGVEMRLAGSLRFAEFHYLQIKLYSLVGARMMDEKKDEEEEKQVWVIDIRVVLLGVWFGGR